MIIVNGLIQTKVIQIVEKAVLEIGALSPKTRVMIIVEDVDENKMSILKTSEAHQDSVSIFGLLELTEHRLRYLETNNMNFRVKVEEAISESIENSFNNMANNKPN